MYKKKKAIKMIPAPLDMEEDIRNLKERKKKIKVKIFEEPKTKTKAKTKAKK